MAEAPTYRCLTHWRGPMAYVEHRINGRPVALKSGAGLAVPLVDCRGAWTQSQIDRLVAGDWLEEREFRFPDPPPLPFGMTYPADMLTVRMADG
jgi:hypothetical protein